MENVKHIFRNTLGELADQLALLVFPTGPILAQYLFHSDIHQAFRSDFVWHQTRTAKPNLRPLIFPFLDSMLIK